MNRESQIYVAGHRGLVGSAIVRALEGAGYRNLVTRTHAGLDLTDQAATRDFFASVRPEVVIDAAARVGGIHANDSYPADFIRDNLLIQNNLIDCAHRCGVEKFVFLGSSCIYPREAPQPIREEYLLTGALEPTNEWYAIAKIAGIKMCQAYRRQYGFDAISLMPTNLYGPNDNFDLETSHVLPALIRKFHLAKLAAEGDLEAIERDEARFGPIPDDLLRMLALGRDPKNPSCLTPHPSRLPKVVLWGTGSPRREFLHVDDLASATLFLLENYSDEPIVNVGTGEDLPIRELAELVREAVGFEGEVIWDESRPDGTPRKLLDVSRLREMGWEPRIGLREGIGQTLAWYRRQVGQQ